MAQPQTASQATADLLIAMEDAALHYMRDRAATNCIRPHEARVAALDAIAAPAKIGGVGVKAIVPENRASYRRPHVRYIYRLHGKVVSRVAALAGMGMGAVA